MPVNAVDLNPFAEACGLTRPIDLRVVRSDGVVLAEGELDIPCAVVGRDPACEVMLTDADVGLRHACVQAVGGRVMIADTGSRTGLTVGGEKRAAAWLTPTDPVAIGSFRITLRKPLFARPTLPDATPLSPHPSIDSLPKAAVRFLNGKSLNSAWVVNRAVTFVGRAAGCKISLAADDVAPYHCYFVLTPAGLWVVDLLSPNPVRVNNEPVRYALLEPGDRLTVGRFRLGVDYPDRATAAAVAATATIAAPRPDPAPAEPATTAALVPRAAPAPVADPAMTPLVQQFAAAQSQMLEQFQVSMAKVLTMFGELHREQVSTLQTELARFAELNVEMQKLHAQLAPPEHHNPLPDPDTLTPASDETAEKHNWVYERMTALQAERQSLWDRLTSLVNLSGKASA